ncbi:DUF222 domain-containing protein [Microbispora hainanensis]|uniref:DUF222 domain-containing protein n=1 Tax=Microbispora hainanensis TaxID=568844 RepID=UPI003408C1B0
MDLFDIDPERLRRSNDGDGEWWDRLIANSPLWSSDGSSAREPFPIIGLDARQHADAPGAENTDAPGTDAAGGAAAGADATRTDSAGANAAGMDGPGTDAARGDADGADAAGTDTAGRLADGADAARGDAARGDADGVGASDVGAARGDATDAGVSDAGGRGRGRVRSSWVLVGSVREVAQELALVPLPDDVDMCLAEAEELLFARDRITCALADRVGRVHRAGQAKQHGHASTRCWLRTAGGMTVGGAGRLLTLGAELPRLPQVWEKFAAGELAAGVVEAICAAVAGLTDEQATLAEPILVELAGKAGAAEVAKAGRHLRAVLDPDGEERDEQADYGRRFLRVRPGKGGGVEGEFYLPREPGARLMTLLQEYAKKKADGDDRTLTERQADALIAALEQQIVTELLVVVSAESLPTDPENTDPATEDPADDISDPAPCEANDSVSGAMSGPDHAGGADDLDGFDAVEAEEFNTAEAGADAGSDTGPDGAADACTESADDAWETAENGLGDVREAGTDHATDPTTGSGDGSAGRDAESLGCGAGECAAGEQWPGECEPRDTARTTSPEGNDTAKAASAEGEPRNTASAASAEADDAEGDETVSTSPAECDDTASAMGGDDDRAAAQSGAPHATRRASAWPADGGRRSRTAPSDTAPSETASSGATASDTASSGAPPSQAAPSEAAQPDPPPEDASAPHTHAGPRPARDCRHGQEGIPGALGTALRGSLGMVPGLLLATGQVLPLSSVHRLARTSTLVRIVMNAEGQVLDMGRKVRLATPAQRRAIYARYATCWIDGCPLPATMCQIDHADNWSTGGLTDLKLLGPACQFHNRDRYQHPDRYTRRKEGTDRWAFTYHRLGTARRLRE